MFLGKTIETFFVLFFLMHNALHNKKKHSYETYEIIYL